MENNLDLFICTHKEFYNPTTSDIYKILGLGENCKLPYDNVYYDNTGDNISNMNGFYAELSGIYWVWKNYNIKDFVGFCHYRRFFSFYDNIPNLSDIHKDIIFLPNKKKVFKTTYSHYCYSHAKIDIDCIIDIISDKYNFDKNNILNILYDNAFYPFNIFIMSKENFNEYCEFVFDVFNEFIKRNNINNIEDVKNRIINNKESYFGKYIFNITGDYINSELKIAGYLGERLTTLWILLFNKQIGEIEIEEKI